MRLRLATPAEQAERDILTHQAWGARLSVEAFQARERALRAHRWCAAGMRSWWWVDAADRPLASCETFDELAAVGPRVGRCGLIASVFTAPELRGRGHAPDMLRALHQAWVASPPAGWTGPAHPLGMVLFSEVGEAFYASLGYRAVRGYDVVLPAVRRQLEARPEATRVERAPGHVEGVLDVARTEGHVDWHLERERQYATLLGRPRPPRSSVQVGSSAMGWAQSLKVNELQVLWMDVGAPGDAELCLAYALDAAAELGLPTARLWVSGPDEWPARMPGARVEPRADIPMFWSSDGSVRTWRPVERAHWV